MYSVSDLSMLVFYFRGHAFMVYLRTIKVHNDSVFKELITLSSPEIPPMESPHAFGFPNINTSPCPQNSIIVNPPSPLEIRKAIHGIGMDIFWNRPFTLGHTVNIAGKSLSLKLNPSKTTVSTNIFIANFL